MDAIAKAAGLLSEAMEKLMGRQRSCQKARKLGENAVQDEGEELMASLTMGSNKN